MSSVFPADLHQTLLIRADAPEEWKPDVDQQEPEHLHMKEEKEELWTRMEGEQLSVKEETDASWFSFTAVHVKTEDDEEKPLFSQLRHHQTEDRDVPTSSSADQMKVEADGEDCGGAETSRNPDLNPHGDASSSSETEVSEDDEEDEDGNNADSQHFYGLTDMVFPADVQQTLLIRGDAPEEWRPDVDQQDPEHLHIKEEEEELWTRLEGEQLIVKEETDASRFSFTAVPLKSEDDEEKPLFSHLHQHQMEDRDVPTSRNPALNPHGDTSSSSETEVSEDDEEDQDGNNPDSQLEHLSDSGSTTEDSDKDWKESRAPDPLQMFDAVYPF
ncbi:F-actin-monooxygenase MICAL3-like [Nematolebias whitei]|uniref:F-actin-monooxygenase MICAL3-like n=1 Tax=Nematolebias whitei TaxID=451745 RepID=UPI0018995E73|nr:F-actin-monooxygenase MICAL3-like [Nematolebias whitei]